MPGGRLALAVPHDAAVIDAAIERYSRRLSRLLAWTVLLLVVQPLAAQSVRERVRTQASYTYYHGITAEMAQERVGPAGVPALLELLADPTFPRRDNVVAFLLTWVGASRRARWCGSSGAAGGADVAGGGSRAAVGPAGVGADRAARAIRRRWTCCWT